MNLARRMSNQHVFTYIFIRILSWRDFIDHVTPIRVLWLMSGGYFGVASSSAFYLLIRRQLASGFCNDVSDYRIFSVWVCVIGKNMIWVATAAYKHEGTPTCSTDTMQPDINTKLAGMDTTFMQLKPTFLNRSSVSLEKCFDICHSCFVQMSCLMGWAARQATNLTGPSFQQKNI